MKEEIGQCSLCKEPVDKNSINIGRVEILKTYKELYSKSRKICYDCYHYDMINELLEKLELGRLEDETIFRNYDNTERRIIREKNVKELNLLKEQLLSYRK